MKRILATVLPAIVSLALAACGSLPDVGPVGAASIRISLLEDDGVLLTKATPSQIGRPAVERFGIAIVREHQGSSQTVFEGAYSSNPITVSPGTYTLLATCGSNEDLAFDSPYYSGSAQVQVDAGATASVEIPCSVGNCLLSVVFANPEVFADQFSSYGVLVGKGGKSLDLTASNSGKSAYFPDGSSLSLTFHATLSDNGREVEMSIVDPSLPEVFSAGTHTILTLSASVPASGTVLSVQKVEVETVSVAATIPMEWFPKPSVGGFSGASSIECYETAPASSETSLSFSAHSPIQDVEFSLDLKNPEHLRFNGTYLLSSVPDQTREELAAIGIVLPALDGTSKSGSIGLGGLVPKLKTDNGNDATNRVSLRVKANGRWSSEKPETFTITVKKPVFSVTVLPGDVWTKEFTAQEVSASKGDASAINADITYQLSSDGGATWQEFNDGRRQSFASVPALKSYKVRACYRGCIYSENLADAVLETPVQLPNSDMESWSVEKLSSGGVFLWKAYYDFLPYSSGERDIWWATNNKRSRDYSVSAVDVTTSPCVSYSESVKHGGNRSALMYTSGHGGGYASTITIVYPQGSFAGSLFIGSYDWNDGSETVDLGHPFPSRPSALTFWYKYAPKNTDQFMASIELRSGDEVIATGSYIPAAYSSEDNAFVQARAELTYTDSSKAATSISVRFLSTTKTSFSKSDFNVGAEITFPVMGKWNAHIGSKLYIDDLNLEYSR